MSMNKKQLKTQLKNQETLLIYNQIPINSKVGNSLEIQTFRKKFKGKRKETSQGVNSQRNNSTMQKIQHSKGPIELKPITFTAKQPQQEPAEVVWKNHQPQTVANSRSPSG